MTANLLTAPGTRPITHFRRWALLLLGLMLLVGLPSKALAQISFAPQTTFATGNMPNAVAIGDLDGDGDLDLAVTNEADDTVSILLNNGVAVFALGSSPGTGFTPNSVAIGNFDGDADLDLAVTNGAANTLSILLNNGAAVFVLGSSPATGLTPVSVALGDLDADGDLDIVVVNNLSAPPTVSALLNTGTGTFGAQTTFAVGNSPNDVALGDLDGDGDLDIVVTNGTDDTVSVLLNTTPPPAPPAGGGGGGSSGFCFIATAAFGSPLAPQVQLLRDFRDRYLLTNGPGRLFTAAYYRISPPLADLVAESEVLRAIVRAMLIPVIGWMALFMWSPVLGITIPLAFVGIGSRMARRATRRYRARK